MSEYPDYELVTIAYDEYGVYILGTPYARKTLLPHVKRLDRFDYLVGDTKPNYPLPVLVRCPWCNEPEYSEYCSYNATGIWCPMLCFGY